MSDFTDDQDRFGAGRAPRNTAIPRIVVTLGIVGILLLIGMVISTFVTKILNISPVGEERTSSSQLAVADQTPFSAPVDTPAPPRAAQAPPPNTAPATTPAAAQPQPTVIERVSQATGMQQTRQIMEPAPSGWADIGKNYTSSAGAFSNRQPVSAVERAAAAFGGRSRSPDLEGSRATAMDPRDLSRTIRPGTRVFCTTQHAIDTTTGAGTFVCDIDYAVQAWDGMTPLIPPHSWITASYRELQNGSNRVYAASGILTTPDGNVVSLGDPFTMPDGSNGVEVLVQDKTWARLKEGLILDFAQSAFQAAASAVSQQNQGGNNFGSSSNLNLSFQPNATQQAVQGIIEKNASIRDVGRLAQGAHISMTILGPVFFQDALEFRMRAGAR